MEKNRYFEFLLNVVKGSDHTLLLSHIHSTNFYPLVPNDDNRGADGNRLRDLFIDKVGPTGARFLPSESCTLLEMLIGLADRLEFELLGGKYERPMAEWFWVLLDNLGLTEFTDDIYYERGIIEVDNILLTLLERKYDTDGNGGLFPLKKPKKDQRRIEIWYQMSAWVIENYPI